MSSYQVVDIRRSLPKHPTRKWKKRPTPTRIVVHTTASENQDPNKTAQYHIHAGKTNHISTLGCPGLVYHDFITRAGIIYHCNNYEDWTWHAGLYNKSSVGVVMAFAGQTNGVVYSPEQFEALMKHLVILCLYMKILPKNVIGHREVPGMFTILGKGSVIYKKSCPGYSVDLVKMRAELTLRLQRRLAAEGLYTGKIDGIFGKMSQDALSRFLPPEKSIDCLIQKAET